MFAGAVLIWAYFALPETRPDHITGGGLRFIAHESRELFSDRRFIGYVLVCAIGTATFFAFLGGGPHVVIGIMARSSAEYGLWFILTSGGFMLGNFIAARFSQRYGVDAMVHFGLLWLVGRRDRDLRHLRGAAGWRPLDLVRAAASDLVRQRRVPAQLRRRRRERAPAGRGHRIGHHRLRADGDRRRRGAGHEPCGRDRDQRAAACDRDGGAVGGVDAGLLCVSGEAAT